MLRFKEYTQLVEQEQEESETQLNYYDYLGESYDSEEYDILMEDYYTNDEEDDADTQRKKADRRRARDIGRNALDATYGKSKDIDLPITGNDRIKSVEDHVRDHYSKSSEDQAKAIADAKERLAKVYSKTSEDNQKDVDSTRAELNRVKGANASPEAIKMAQSRHNAAKASKPFSSKNIQNKIFTKNKKLSTIDKLGIRDKYGRLMSTTLGATGAPFKYKHQVGGTEKTVTTCKQAVDGCSGHEGARDGNCLAMTGAYGFTQNATKQDLDSQVQHDSRQDKNGNSPHKDWHLLAAHFALEEATKAKNARTVDEAGNTKDADGKPLKGKSVALRTNVTDESKDALNNAIHKMKTGEIKIHHTDGAGNVTHNQEANDTIKHNLALYNYGKDHRNTIHDPEHNVFTIASDTGPVVSSTGDVTKINRSRENSLKKITSSANGNTERNHYTIVGGQSSTDNDENGRGRFLKRANSNDKPSQQAWVKNKLDSINTVRRYNLKSEPASEAGNVHKDHEARDMGNGRVHHFHRETGADLGHGYVKTKRTINGEPRIVRYQDHNVIPHASEHDARFSPDEHGTNVDKDNNKVGASIVSIPTAATSHTGTASGTMFHNVNDIDKHGVLHVNHPDKIDKARKTLTMHNDKEWSDKLDEAK